MTIKTDSTATTDFFSEPGACPECRDAARRGEGIAPGHFACSIPRDALLAEEDASQASCELEDGRWVWQSTQPPAGPRVVLLPRSRTGFSRAGL